MDMEQNTELPVRFFKKVLKRGDMTIYTETFQAREDIGFAPIGLDEPYRVFISEGPIGFEGGSPNLFAYASNNPVLLIDPSGLWTLQLAKGNGVKPTIYTLKWG
jgi:hypothetical protein